MLRILVESPPLLADLFMAASIYAYVRRDKSDRAALIAMLMVALNPALLYDTVVWGQCDSVLTFTMLLSILALHDERYELGFAMAAISVLVKPQALMLLPVLALWTLRHADRRTWVRCMLAFIAAVLIVIAPFQIGHPWNWILDLYASTAAGFQETSVNAFNLLALLGGIRQPDSNTIAGHSYYAIGMLLLVPLYAFIAWIVWTARTARPLLFASFISIFGFFMLAPRMHERYIYPAIVLAAPLALEAPMMAAMFVILTLTALFNLAYVFQVLHTPSMLLDPRDGLAMAASAFNLVALTMAVYFGAGAIPAQAGTPGTEQGEEAGAEEPQRKTALSD
jgi:Gpi18-like mannosyltransferase